MIRRPLTCPICGDRWKMVLVESSLRLGPPVRTCRACRGRFTTSECEWNNMEGVTKAGYFLQNLVVVMPIMGLLILAIIIALFEDMIGSGDAWEYFGWGCLFSGSIFLLLSIGNVLAIISSKLRSARERKEQMREQATGNPEGEGAVTLASPTMPPPVKPSYPHRQS